MARRQTQAAIDRELECARIRYQNGYDKKHKEYYQEKRVELKLKYENTKHVRQLPEVKDKKNELQRARRAKEKKERKELRATLTFAEYRQFLAEEKSKKRKNRKIVLNTTVAEGFTTLLSCVENGNVIAAISILNQPVTETKEQKDTKKQRLLDAVKIKKIEEQEWKLRCLLGAQNAAIRAVGIRAQRRQNLSQQLSDLLFIFNKKKIYANLGCKLRAQQARRDYEQYRNEGMEKAA